MYRIGPHKINLLIKYLVYVVYDLLGATYKNINWTATSLPKTLAGEGAPTYVFAKFSKKLHEIFKKFGP